MISRPFPRGVDTRSRWIRAMEQEFSKTTGGGASAMLAAAVR